MSKLACPNRESLLSVALGDAETPELEAHVETCPSCQAEVERLRGDVGMLRQRSAPGRTTAPAHDTVLGDPAHAEDAPTPAILGKYWIVGELGQGGQARVFRGVHVSMDRDVAIKWSKEPLRGPAQNALLQEARLLADLDHPGIVRVHDLDLHDGRPYLVMEYVRGRDLEQYAQGKPMAPRDAARLVGQLARAVQAAHARGITHQDIKPANVLIDEAGRPRLTDFGIARLQNIWNSDPANQRSGGTLAFMAPEQADPNAAGVGPACDVFGLGGVLFYLLTGQPPRSQSGNFNTALQEARAGVVAWTALDSAKVPLRLRAVLHKALATDPTQRYASAQALADDLERFVAAPAVFRRRLSWFAACAAALLLGLGIFAIANRPTSTLDAKIAPTPLTLRVQRDGVQTVLKTQNDIDALGALREKDKIGLAGDFPAGVRVALFSLAVNPSGKIDVADLGSLEISRQHYVTTNVFPLQRSPATEIIVACGNKDAPPTRTDLAKCLADLSVIKPIDLSMLRNVHVRFNADKVDAVRGLIGAGEADPVAFAVGILDQIRLRLGRKFDFIDGIAFCHLPAEQAAPRQADGGTTQGEPQKGPLSEEDQLLKDAIERLLASEIARAQYPEKYLWPPLYKVVVFKDRPDVINAVSFAVAEPGSAKKRPVIQVTRALIEKIAQGRNREVRLARLAAVVGHELGHVFLDHIATAVNFEKIETLAVGRSEELDADFFGMRLTASAGFPQAECLRSAEELQKLLGGRSDFRALKETHPTWEQRLARMDKDRKKYWTSLAAFSNGVFFLDCERYADAEACFRHVLDDMKATGDKKLEDCKEAWANIGYAKLMMYCDAQSLGDLRKQGIGQIALGAFYARPSVPTRDGDEKLWKEAVAALQKAADGSDLLLPRANLAIAFLMHFDGKPRLEEADRYFDEAIQLAKKDKGLDDLNVIPILINWGVLDLAKGKREDAAKKFARARELVRALKAPHPFDLETPLDYNEALLLAASNDRAQKERAFALWENYLRFASPSSTWWKLGVEKYQALGMKLGVKTQTEQQLAQRFAGDLLRVVPSVRTEDKIIIELGADTEDVLERLKADQAKATPAYPRSTLKRYHEVRPGVDIMGGQELLAIFLTSNKAPAIQVQAKGLGAEKFTLFVGKDVRDLPKELQRQPFQRRTVTEGGTEYDYYPNLGVGIQRDGQRITGLVITQAPRKMPGI